MSKKNMINADNISYWHYTGPQRVDKAMHSLEGILIGIASDGVIGEKELRVLEQWLKQHKGISHKHPFNEAYSTLKKALSDGILDEEEKEDLLWFCNMFTTEDKYFSLITSDLQKLHGILGGIVADGIISKEELEALSLWMEENEHIRKNWPFEELESLITEVLKDGKIDEEEHELLKAFFAEFLETKDHKALTFPLSEVEKPITGLCAVCPEVIFEENTFCFTGKFEKSPRRELVSIVNKYGGIFSNGLKKEVDFLVIGADGNPAWAFSCYGRKVERAVQLRKEGSNLLIVHEHDFWDAVEEKK